MTRPAYRLKNSRKSGPAIQSGAVKGFVKKVKSTDTILKTTKSQRVQRGTNRPSGKRVKARKNESKAISPTNEIGNHDAECLNPIVSRTGIVPPNTRASANSNDIRSSDLRHKIKLAVPKKTKAKRVASATMKVA